MVCGYVMNTWRGPGDTYQRLVGSGVQITTSNQKNRWLPFRDEPMAHVVTAPGARNFGDSRVQWGSTRTADEISRDENFKF